MAPWEFKRQKLKANGTGGRADVTQSGGPARYDLRMTDARLEGNARRKEGLAKDPSKKPSSDKRSRGFGESAEGSASQASGQRPHNEDTEAAETLLSLRDQMDVPKGGNGSKGEAPVPTNTESEVAKFLADLTNNQKPKPSPKKPENHENDEKPKERDNGGRRK